MIDDEPETYTVDVLRKWKVAAELRANREFGQSPSAAEVGRASALRFKVAMELAATPEGAAITHALFATPNPYAELNRTIASLGITLMAEPRGWELCHRSFKAIIEELLADLAEYAELRDGVNRLVTTNTSVERVGQQVWNVESGFRSLVSRTAHILANSSASFELWRVFLLRDPRGVVERGEVDTFYATLAENIGIGANVAIASTSAFPEIVPLDFSDFHCVPGRLAFVNVVPTYLAARFEQNRSDDRAIVQCYSHISELLVEGAINDAPNCFRWLGGPVAELASRMAAMDSRTA